MLTAPITAVSIRLPIGRLRDKWAASKAERAALSSSRPSRCAEPTHAGRTTPRKRGGTCLAARTGRGSLRRGSRGDPPEGWAPPRSARPRSRALCGGRPDLQRGVGRRRSVPADASHGADGREQVDGCEVDRQVPDAEAAATATHDAGAGAGHAERRSRERGPIMKGFIRERGIEFYRLLGDPRPGNRHTPSTLQRRVREEGGHAESLQRRRRQGDDGGVAGGPAAHCPRSSRRALAASTTRPRATAGDAGAVRGRGRALDPAEARRDEGRGAHAGGGRRFHGGAAIGAGPRRAARGCRHAQQVGGRRPEKPRAPSPSRRR